MFYKIYLNVLRLTLRSGFLKIGLCGLVILLVGVFVASGFSGRQPATVGLDIGISIIRLILPFIIALMAQEIVGREFERRYYFLSISYPFSRIYFLVTRFVAVIGLVLLLLAVMGAFLALLIAFMSISYNQANPVSLTAKYGLVLISIFIEALVIAAVAQFVAVVARTPGFVVIAVLGFTFIGRSYRAVINLIVQDASVVGDFGGYGIGLEVLRYLLPDLGGLDVREIALYDQWGLLSRDWVWSAVASIMYACAFLLLGFWALKYKRFN